jgi:hypothetical protein
MTQKKRCALLCALVDADARDDAAALGRLGWVLFDLLCQAEQARSEAVEMLDELTAVARVIVAGDGGAASIRQVRDVLANQVALRQQAQTPRVPAGRG